MTKKCFVCGREIPKKEIIILTLEGACCTICENTEQYKEITLKAKKEGLAALNRHFE